MNSRPIPPRVTLPPDSLRGTDYVHHFVRSHCKYEVRTTRSGTTVVATPLSKAAKEWMAQQRMTFLQMRCERELAGMTVRNIECAIDTQ